MNAKLNFANKICASMPKRENTKIEMNWSEKRTHTHKHIERESHIHSHGRMNLFEQASASKYISNNNIIYSITLQLDSWASESKQAKFSTYLSLFKWKWKHPKNDSDDDEEEKTENPFGNCNTAERNRRTNHLCIYPIYETNQHESLSSNMNLFRQIEHNFSRPNM